jgi:hypothetical protein
MTINAHAAPSEGFVERNANQEDGPAMQRERQVQAWLQQCLPNYEVVKFGMDRLSEDIPPEVRRSASFVDHVRRPDLAVVPDAWDREDLSEALFFVEVKSAKLYGRPRTGPEFRGWALKPADIANAEDWQQRLREACAGLTPPADFAAIDLSPRYQFAFVTQDLTNDNLVALVTPKRAARHVAPANLPTYPSGTSVLPMSYLARPLWLDMTVASLAQQRVARPEFAHASAEQHHRGPIPEINVSALCDEERARFDARFDGATDDKIGSRNSGSVTAKQLKSLSEIAEREGRPLPLVTLSASASQGISSMPTTNKP